MTNEAVIIEKYGPNSDGGLIRRTVASNAAIAYGTLLYLADPNTVAANGIVLAPFGGIAAMEKKNNDYSTTITVFTDVVADLTASGAIAAGSPVTIEGTANLNYVSQADASMTFASMGGVVGFAQETAATGEVIRVRVSPLT